MITQNYLKEWLRYEPETGEFTSCFTGKRVGSIDNKGYIRLLINKKRYRAHRLAWLYVTGEWPKNQIDHKDEDKQNNRFANLRDVSQSINMCNKNRPYSNSKTGYLGVSKIGARFGARLMNKGILRHLGIYDTPEQAHAVYLKAKEEYVQTLQ